MEKFIAKLKHRQSMWDIATNNYVKFHCDWAGNDEALGGFFKSVDRLPTTTAALATIGNQFSVQTYRNCI